jgi:hypothetical protein
VCQGFFCPKSKRIQPQRPQRAKRKTTKLVLVIKPLNLSQKEKQQITRIAQIFFLKTNLFV